MYLSKSKIHTYLDCPFKFKCAFIDCLPSLPVKAFEKGSALHKIFEEYYTLGKVGEYDGYEKDIAHFLAYVEYTKHEKPAFIEVNLKDHKEHLEGTADVIIKIDGMLTLLDYKSSSFFGDFEKYELQLAVYQQLAHANKIPVEAVGILFTTSGHLVTKKADDYYTRVVKDIAKSVQEGIGKEAYEPKINEWCCSCGYRDRCAAYQALLKAKEAEYGKK